MAQVHTAQLGATKKGRLQDRVAIITGAGRGIGEAIALRFATEGARLVLASRTHSELESVAGKIRSTGGNALPIVTDVNDREQATKLMQSALNAFCRIDILVNAAGTYGPIGPVWEVNAVDWEQAFSTNLFGTFALCQAVLPHMIQARKGKIINFSGGGATAPLPRFSAYGVSKAAVVRFTETLAEEVKEFNIQVNAIAPGAVDTRLQDQVLAAGDRAGELAQRIRRLRETGEGGTSPHVPAELALFLASDDSSNLTGRLISAPHDGWQSWNCERIDLIMSQAWFTLRRMDQFTLQPLLEEMKTIAAATGNK